MSSEIPVNSYLPDPEPENADAPVRKVDKNTFVQATITSYDRENLKNDTLWEQFRENFVGWTEDDFISEVLNIRLRRLRNVLRKRDVWVLKDSRIIIAKFLIRILEEEHLTFWIEEEIVNNAEKFASDVIDHLRKTNFDRNLIDYSWQAAQSRSESQKSESARQSPLRERSTQAKSLDQSLNKEKLSIRKRFPAPQPIRQRSSPPQTIKQRSPSSHSIRHRSSSPIFEQLNRQQSPSIELQNVQSTDQQFNRWDSSMISTSNQPVEQQFSKWTSSEKSYFLDKPRRSTPLRSFIESPPRSISAFLILSSSSSPPPPLTSRRALTSLPRPSTPPIQKKKPSIKPIKPIASIKIESDFKKELANLTKLYTDETKYNDENDSFSFKLTIFPDMCDRVDVSQSAKLKAFLIMLKNLALDYYYSNMFTITTTVITFDEVCFSMKNYFEDVEYRRDILFKWNYLILRSMMTSNEDKLIEEYL